MIDDDMRRRVALALQIRELRRKQSDVRALLRLVRIHERALLITLRRLD